MNSSNRLLWLFLLGNSVAAVVAVALGLAREGRPDRYFAEGEFATLLSCGQLLDLAALAGGIYRTRRRVAAPGAMLRLWMAAGFVFLAADDAWEFHERMDGWIHSFFRIQQTNLTDRIDDAIIALYAIAALGVLWVCRRELLPFQRWVGQWPLVSHSCSARWRATRCPTGSTFFSGCSVTGR